MIRNLLIIFASFGVALSANLSLAQSVDQVNSLLANWDQPSETNYAAAKSQFERLAPSDVRLSYTMALVAVKQHHLSDAAGFVDQSAQSDKPRLPIRRLQLWLSAAREQNQSAQSQLKKLGEILSASDPTVTANESDATAELMGQIIGFYEGPGAGRIKQDELAATVTELKTKMPADLFTTLDRSRQAVAGTYADLAAQQLRARQDAQAVAAQSPTQTSPKPDALAVVKEKNQQAQQDLQSLQSKAQKDERTDIKKLNRLQADAERQEHRIEGQQRGVVHAARRLANGHLAENPVHKEERRQQAKEKLATDVAKAQDIIASANDEASNLQAAEKTAKRTERAEHIVTAQQQQQAGKPTAPAIPHTPLDGKIGVVSTYATIDLDAEKDRVLASFQKK